jgi:uncharacterized protein YfkK (UPF0435 family)
MTMTINNAIETLEINVFAAENGDEVNAEALREALDVLNSKSRFTAEQKERIAEVAADAAELLKSEGPAKSMAAKLKKAREERYEVSVSASGNKSFYCGDEVALVLEGMTADDVCELADEFCPLEKGTHAARYEGLNIGAARMNAGNRIRGAVRRAEICVRYDTDGNPVGFFHNID